MWIFRKINLLIITFFIVLTSSCKQDNARLKVDVSKIVLNIKIERYEKALFSINKASFKNDILTIENKFPFFLEGINKDTIAINNLQKFVSDPINIQLYNDCLKEFPDLKELEKDLTLAFKHYKFYFPEITIPKVYSYISGLDYQDPIKISDNELIISLDMYLGAQYKAYKNIGVPIYIIQKYKKESIISDCMSKYAKLYLPPKKDNTFLYSMIEAGKIIYFIDAMMPDIADSIKIDYSSAQMEWCIANEARVWAYFIENKLLYNTEKIIFNKFIMEAPFTQAFSKNSPPRIAIWIGWQIVRKYMDNNPKVSLKSLMQNNDAQMILMKSKYKPKK